MVSASRFGLLLASSFILGIAGGALAAPPADEVVQGLYEGMWKDGSAEAKAEVRVIALGKQAFKLLARKTVDDKVSRLDIDGKLEKDSGVVSFAGKSEGGEAKATWKDGKIEGSLGEQTFSAARLERKSASLGKKPPEGAVVLLDGKNFDGMERSGGKPWRLGDMSRHGWPIWEMALVFEGGTKEPSAWPSPDKPLPPGWALSPEKRKVDMVIGIDEDGSIEVPKGGMNSKQDFQGSFDAHLEFRCNFAPTARSQGRGNSGVDLPNGQEIQVLDSFGMGTYLGGGCGGLYNKKDPDVMDPIPSLTGKNESTYTLASLPPLEWQTYDIEFRVKPGEKGKGRLTVYHNGVKIHDAVELGANGGKFRFQDHGNAVRYRNIWVARIKDEEKKEAEKSADKGEPEKKQPDKKEADKKEADKKEADKKEADKK